MKNQYVTSRPSNTDSLVLRTALNSMPRLFLCAALWALPGCDGAPPEEAVDEANLSSELSGRSCRPGSSDVRGTAVEVHVSEAGIETKVPQTQLNVAALPYEGSFSAPIQGTVDAQGKVLIRCVPNGNYLLRVGAIGEDGTLEVYGYEVTSKRTLDLGSRVGWAASSHEPAPNTTFTLHATGLAPMAAEGSVDLVNWGGDFFASAVAGAGEVGSRSLSRQLTEDDGFLPVLDDESNRLTLYAYQRVPLALPGLGSGEVAAAAAKTDLTVSEGHDNVLAFRFSEAAKKRTHLEWEVSDDQRLISEFQRNHSGASVSSDMVAGWVYPRGANSQAGVPLLFLESPTRDLEADIEYADPFGPQWSREVHHWLEMAAPLSAGGGVAIGYRWKLGQLDGSVHVGPVMGPPTNIRVNGLATHSSLENVGLVPEITWNAPTFGRAPTGYRVTIREVDGSRWQQWLLEVETPYRHLKVPAGWLTAGKAYVFSVSARLTNGPVSGSVWDATEAVWTGARGPVFQPVTGKRATTQVERVRAESRHAHRFNP